LQGHSGGSEQAASGLLQALPGKARNLPWSTHGDAMPPLDPSFFIKVTVVEALFAIPAGLILKRTGHSMWWALLCFIPVAALFGLWVLAFTRWTPPSETAKAED
jgi:hypothetical protein